MIEIIKEFDKKKYNVISKSLIKIHEIPEIMQIDNIIEQSIEKKENLEYEVFIDIVDTKVAVNNKLKPLQKIALNLYFLTEEVKILTNNEMKALKVINKKEIEDKWKLAKEKLFSSDATKESEILALMKNDIELKIKDEKQLLSFATAPLIYDIFFGGFYIKEKVETEKIKENYILDMNIPLKMIYTDMERNLNERTVKIEVLLEKNKISQIKLMDIFKKFNEEYKPDNLFLEGEGIIKINNLTGRIKEGSLRIEGGILGTFTNMQEVIIKEIIEE